jgi:hypothetical protein
MVEAQSSESRAYTQFFDLYPNPLISTRRKTIIYVFPNSNVMNVKS